jgi:hypothetical protein
MEADSTVCCKGPNDWVLTGTATFVEEPWDFERNWAKFVKGVSANIYSGTDDMSGRDVRSHMGSLIPGKSFNVQVSGSVKIKQTKSDQNVQYGDGK